MALSIIPLTSAPNQTVSFRITIQNVNYHLKLFLRYLEVYQHWTMDVTDITSGTMLLTNIPLVPGFGMAANILAQYEYLGIGEAYIASVSDTSTAYPDKENLGSQYVLVWGEYNE